jgi:hypothetical protein
MITFEAYATNSDIYPKRGRAFEFLSPLFGRLAKVDFTLRVVDPTINQGQMDSDFDRALETALFATGAAPLDLQLPAGVPQELDFAFIYDGRKVALEIEKANREKILRDILKCHMYLQAGADFALVVLAKNYAHKHGIWDLFEFGCQRLDECARYGFGTPEKLGRILLLSYQQFDSATGKPFSAEIRRRIREEAAAKASK